MWFGGDEVGAGHTANVDIEVRPNEYQNPVIVLLLSEARRWTSELSSG